MVPHVSLRRRSPADVRPLQRDPVDPETLTAAAQIVADVRDEGEHAVRRWAEKLGDIPADAPLILEPSALEEAFEGLPAHERAVLERTADRIRTFALAQRHALSDVEVPVPGGVAGHQVAPVECAGCYAPGGRFPLPSSVLMTAVTARAAGVGAVWVASPRPTPVTLAAAHVAGADGLLAVGGAQAIAAFAYGMAPVPACDVVCGPGNRWVTAAKQLVSGRVAIDLLAGPSELLVLADAQADPEVIAADLLAQAEHDVHAVPWLVTPSSELASAVDRSLAEQLAALPEPSQSVATASLANGAAVVVRDLAEGCAVADRIAPEHLEVMGPEAEARASELRHWGGLFVGAGAAEVLGDYGVGPNHTLPTGGTARSTGGLSVLTFLRVRTWMRMASSDPDMVADAVALARLEGLEAHAPIRGAPPMSDVPNISSTVDRVTVYRQGARVVRRAELPEGVATVRFVDLPLSLVDDGLRLRVLEGPVRMTDVRVTLHARPRSEVPPEPDMERLQAATRERTRLRRRQEHDRPRAGAAPGHCDAGATGGRGGQASARRAHAGTRGA